MDVLNYGPPEYTLVDQPMIDNGESGIIFMARLTCEGKEFDGVVVGFKQFQIDTQDNGVPKVSVDYTIISIPESLAKHQKQIHSKTGKISRKLSKAIDKATSLILGPIVQEELQRIKDNNDGAGA